MTDRQFLDRIIFLTEKMCNIYDAEPLDQDARLAILAEVHKLGQRFNRSRRPIPWGIFYLIIFLLVVLFWLIFDTLRMLQLGGPQL